MKTYKKTIEKPRLVISYDDQAESPRTSCDNLGYFITCDSRYNSPDKYEELETWIKETGNEAKDLQEHIECIFDWFKQNDKKALYVFPIAKYEHSGVVYSLGNKQGFDYSNNGFYIVLENDETKDYSKEKIEEIIKGELEDYNKWANGEIYKYEIWDENGTFEGFYGGFYNIEDIRENLPEEWKEEKLVDYFKN